jgi:hypothetical protein
MTVNPEGSTAKTARTEAPLINHRIRLSSE